MKLTSLFIITSIVLSSCFSSKIIPLKGKYPSLPIQVTTEKDFAFVWDKIIDLFAQRGLPIKIIDRSSGLIICDKTVLKTTIENSKGLLDDNEAWIVVPKTHDPGLNRDVAVSGSSSGVYSKKMLPNDVNGEWNVRVKSENGKTLVNVNIVNVRYEDYNGQGYSKNINIQSFASTGVFEKLILDSIK